MNLPEGLVLDDNVSLPDGFVLDTPPSSVYGKEAGAPGQGGVSDGSEKNAPEWAGRHPNLYGIAGAARETLGPVAEVLGLAGGAVAGSAAGVAASAPTAFTGSLPMATAGGAAGAGMGYAGVKNFLDFVDVQLGNAKGNTLTEQAWKSIKNIAVGATIEAGGQSAGPIVEGAAKLVGKGIVQTLGATTGAGPGAIEESVSGGKAFTDALRGKTTGEQIVDDVRGALSVMKDKRAGAYQSKLSQIRGNDNPIDTGPVQSKLADLMNKYNIKYNADGSLDTSRIAMGKSGRKDIEDIIDTVSQWGKKEGDNTAIGMDTLKRQLDDFYSDSSQARQFVTTLRNSVKDTIVDSVPEYSEMTKGYSDATRLIKEVEKGLMLKNGQTYDQTLRRLTSSMRENFEMRRELVDAMGDKELPAEIAGYAMSSIKPRGLAGTGPALGIESFLALKYLNPKFWPILASSSPRAVGEFLNLYGKTIRSGAAQSVKSAGPALSEDIAYTAGSRLKDLTPSSSMKMPELVQSAEANDGKKYRTRGNVDDLTGVLEQ